MIPDRKSTAIKLESHSIGIGLTDDSDSKSEPVCLILSYDSLDICAEIAFRGKSAQLDQGDLLIHSPIGSLRLVNVGLAIIDAAALRLPIVVLDPINEREVMIEIWDK